MGLVRVLDVDIAFAVLFGVDAAWLWAAGRLAAVPAAWWRLALAAGAGAAADVLAQFPAGWPLHTWPGRLLGSMLLVALAYGSRVRPGALWRLLGFFWLAGAVMAGTALLLAAGHSRGLALAPRGNGVYTGYASPAAPDPLVAAGVALALAGGRQVLGAAAAWRRLRRGLLAVEVTLGAGRVCLPALVDTGNQLREPLSGRPVVVAEAAALAHLLPPALARAAGAPAEGGTLAELPPEWAARCRLVPYRAVGTAAGLLLAVRPDGLLVAGAPAGAYLALAPAPLDPSGTYRALLPAGLDPGGVPCGRE